LPKPIFTEIQSKKLKKLGILNATKKASVLEEAPKIFANMISLIKPEILEIKVIPPTIKDDLVMKFLVFCLFWSIICI